MGLLANILKTGNSRSFPISYVCVPLVNTLNLCDLRMRLKSSIAFIPSLFLCSPFWDSLASSPGWPENCSTGPIRWLSRCKQAWRPESACMERWKERTDSTGLSFYLHRIPIAVHPASASWVLLWLQTCATTPGSILFISLVANFCSSPKIFYLVFLSRVTSALYLHMQNSSTVTCTKLPFLFTVILWGLIYSCIFNKCCWSQQMFFSLAWWYTPLIVALGRQRQAALWIEG